MNDRKLMNELREIREGLESLYEIITKLISIINPHINVDASEDEDAHEKLTSKKNPKPHHLNQLNKFKSYVG